MSDFVLGLGVAMPIAFLVAGVVTWLRETSERHRIPAVYW
jgi:hypothetical protein